MALQVPMGFYVSNTEPIDPRLVLTKEEMMLIENYYPTMPDVYFCVCADDQQIYIYDKYGQPTLESIGQFRPYKAASNDTPTTPSTIPSLDWGKLGK